MKRKCFKIIKAIFIFAITISSFNLNVEIVAQADTIGVKKSALLSGKSISIDLATAQKLTVEDIIEKSGVSYQDKTVRSEELIVNDNQLRDIQAAADGGKFPLELSVGEELISITVSVDSLPETPTNKAATVSISIPEYDENQGWKPEMIYDVIIFADFGENAVQEGKQLEITLPEGMRYVTIPAKERNSDLLVKVDDELSAIINDIEVPEENEYYFTRNGKLVYNFTSQARQVELKGLKITPDGKLYYGSKTFNAGISAIVKNNERILSEAAIEIKTREEAGYAYYEPENPVIVAQAGEQNSVYSAAGYLRRQGRLKTFPFYIKQVELKISYPVGAQVDGLKDEAEINALIAGDDQKRGLVTIKSENVDTLESIGLRFGVDKLAVGRHESREGRFYQLEMYDGKRISIEQPEAKTAVEILSPTDQRINNKLEISFSDFPFDNLTDDYMMKTATAWLKNGQINQKDSQVVEYQIDPNYETIALSIPANPQNPVEKIEYITNKGRKGSATGTQIYSTVSSETMTGYEINKEKLGLEADEYFTYAKASIGDVAKGSYSIRGNQKNQSTNNALFMLGRLKPGAREATLQISTWSEEAGSGVVEEGSLETKIAKVVRGPQMPSVYSAVAPSQIVEAGGRQKIQATLGSNPFYYTGNIGIVNPTIYLRMPQEMNIDLTKISVTQKQKSVIKKIIGPYRTSKGEAVIAIETDAKVGRFFNGMTLEKLEIEYEIYVSEYASGNYDFSELIFFTATRELQPAYGAALAVQDKYDVNNNKDTSEMLGTINMATLAVQENRDLLIDSYMQNVGESKLSTYEREERENKISFTKDLKAKYTLSIINNRDDEINLFELFVPIPKEGLDFGDEYQDEAFTWDMKLASPTPKVIVLTKDGEDISRKRAQDYQITYSKDATSQENYEYATYNEAGDEDTTMIRLKNNNGIAPGEKAIIEWEYQDAEKNNTLARYGLINEFRPRYTFSAANRNMSYQGKKVVAIFKGTEISGLLFEDKVIDGKYNAVEDGVLQGRKIQLLYLAGDNSYAMVAETITDENGRYKFEGVYPGEYRVSFNEGITKDERFTRINKGDAGRIDSDANSSEAAMWLAVVDPSQSVESVTAGIIKYNPDELTITMSNNDEDIVMGPDDKYLLTASIGSKELLSSIRWSSSNSDVVGVTRGSIDALQIILTSSMTGNSEQTAVVGVEVIDIYGTKKSKSVNVIVKNNEIVAKETGTLKLTLGTPAVRQTPADTPVPENWAEIFNVSATNSAGEDITDKVSYIVDKTLTSMKQRGLHRIKMVVSDETGAEVSAEAQLLIIGGESVNNQIIEATSFFIRLKDVKKANYTQLSRVFAYDISNNQEYIKIDTILENDIRPTKVGVYLLTFRTPKGASIVVELLVIADDLDTSDIEFITANDFAIKQSEVNKDDYIKLAKAKAFQIKNYTEVAPIEIGIVAGIEPATTGRYEVTFATENGIKKTVAMLVVPDDIGDNLVTKIYANDFVIKQSDVLDADYIGRADAWAYKITNASEVEEIPILAINSPTRPTGIGEHHVIFGAGKIPNNWVEKQVEMIVVPDDITDPEITLHAENFVIKQAEVATANYLQLANVKAIKVIKGPIAVPISVSLVADIRPTEPGIYELTFTTENQITKTIDMIVVADEAILEDLIVLEANSFAIRESEVASADYRVLAKVKAYEIISRTEIERLEVKRVDNFIEFEEGEYPITFEVENGPQIEVSMFVVPNIVTEQPVTVIEAEGFAINQSAVETADYEELANVSGYTFFEGPEGSVIVTPITEFKVDGPRPRQTGRYEIKITAADGTSKTVPMLVIEDDFPEVPTSVIYANDFAIRQSELSEENYIKFANIAVYLISIDEDGYYSIEEETNFIIDDSDAKDLGDYDLTIIAEDETIKTVTMLVVSDEIGNEPTTVVYAKGIFLKLSQVPTADYRELADLRAYEVINGREIKEVKNIDMVAPEVTGVGVYRLIFSAGNGAVEVPLIVVPDDLGIEPITLIYANDFAIKQSEIGTANYADLADVRIFEVAVNYVGEIVVTENKDFTVDAPTPSKLGVYKVTFKVKNGVEKSVTMVVIPDEQTDESTTLIYATSFMVKQEEVPMADYLKLAQVSAYQVIGGRRITPVEVSVLENLRPREGGYYEITFTTQDKTSKTVEMLILENQPIEENSEVILANNFIVEKNGAEDADYINLAKARAYKILADNSIERIDIILEGPKPINIGLHEITLITKTGVKKAIKVLIYINAPVENEIVIANDATISADELAATDLKGLTNAKGYNIADINNIIEIPVTLATLPIEIGENILTFTTKMGASLDVKLTVLKTEKPYIELTAENAKITKKELKKAQAENKVKELFIKKTKVTATYFSGPETDPIPVAVEPKIPTDIEEIGKHKVKFIATVEEQTKLTEKLTVAVEIIADSEDQITAKPVLPITGENTVELVVSSTVGLILALIALILGYIKKRKI
ncbi:MAG: SdrD B-like domain-containing protein [Culicoidibacterales bacterium]